MNKILFFFIFSAMVLHGSIGMAQEKIYYYNKASISSWDKCLEQAESTLDDRQCDGEASELLEEELNRTYQRLLKKLDKIALSSKEFNYNEVNDFKKKIIAAQRAWIKFRELDLDCVSGLYMEFRPLNLGTTYTGFLAHQANTWHIQQTINMINTLKTISDSLEIGNGESDEEYNDKDNEITSYDKKEITVTMHNLIPEK